MDGLSKALDEVSEGATMTITRHGRPVAVLLGVEEYESLTETLDVLSDSDTVNAIAEALGETHE